MLNAVIRFALRYRFLIVFLSLAAMVYGSYIIATMPIDIFPDLDRPRVVIITECPGYAPEDVETLVTFPLESALNGATGVESVRSQSGPGISVIYVNFQWGTDVYVDRQIVQERLGSVRLPEDVTPQMAPISSLMGQVLFIGLAYKEGPRGGVLAPLSRSDYLAELVREPENHKVKLFVWNSKDDQGRQIDNPKDWQLVDLTHREVTLSWNQQQEITETEKESITRQMTLHSSREGGFVGSGQDLPQEQVFLSRYQYQTTLSVSGKEYALEWSDQRHRQMELRTMADWVVRLRLLKVSGVAQVIAMGGGRKQYQVLVNPKELVRHGVALEDITEKLAQNNLNASGGWAEKGDKEQPIRFLGRISPEKIAQVPIKVTEERVVTLGKVARVVEGPQLKRGDASVNGQLGVVMMITKQPGVDTRQLTTEITEALKDLETSLPANVEINSELFQMKRFIDIGVYNVVEALILGAGLVLLVLFFFLLNFRTTFISLTAIPLSLVTTAIVFRLISWFSETDLSINVMTLGGIAVAMGELVDDSIVDVENIFRRLRQNNLRDKPRSALQVIYEASVEVRSAIVFGTIMVILVFIPLFALSGIEGRLFTPLGIAYIISILSSLLISLTVTPVLSYYLLTKAKAQPKDKAKASPHGEDSPLLRFLKWGNSFLIRQSMSKPLTILVVTWLLVIFSGWLLTTLGSDFLPPFDEGSVQVNISLPPGSSLQASNQVTEQVDRKLLEFKKTEANPDGFILHFVRRTGRAELDEHVEPVSNTEYILNIDPHAAMNREEMLEFIQHELEEMNLGAGIETEQPVAHLISHMLSGVTAQIAIRIYGDDLDQLQIAAKEIKKNIQDVPGIASAIIEGQQMTQEVHISPKEEAWDQFGVDRQHLASFVRTAMYGHVVSQVIEKERRFDLLVRLDEPYRDDYKTLENMILKTEQGTANLGMLAHIDPHGRGPNTVNRDNVRRRIVIRINTHGRDVGSVVADIKEKVNQNVRLPEGYFVEYGGQFESQQRATFLISALALVSGISMFVVLYMLYPSWRIVLQILNALPTAFIGGVMALWLTGQSLTVASMVGFISLGGIAVRNGILLISHYLHLMRYEGEAFSQKMILRGSLERLSPVLMTALTACFALLPLVVTGQEPGREILYPVATVIFGGLITSTFCEFLVRPGLFWRCSGHDPVRLSREMEPEVEEGITFESGKDE